METSHYAGYRTVSGNCSGHGAVFDGTRARTCDGTGIVAVGSCDGYVFENRIHHASAGSDVGEETHAAGVRIDLQIRNGLCQFPLNVPGRLIVVADR